MRKRDGSVEEKLPDSVTNRVEGQSAMNTVFRKGMCDSVTNRMGTERAINAFPNERMRDSGTNKNEAQKELETSFQRDSAWQCHLSYRAPKRR